MSIQFGRWDFSGEPVALAYIEKVNELFSPYGPSGSFSGTGIHMVHRAFPTTKESRTEVQPHVSLSGSVITWDGRLDNRKELLGDLGEVRASTATDVAIVAAAYERWGSQCLARLVGDWALAIWNPHSRSLLLAKDFIGTRHLFYSFDKDQITWSTILDPLVLFAEKTFALDEEYLAGWFSFFPAAHLTPYLGIHAVPPASFVLLRPGECAIEKYWDFDPSEQIRYRSDADYEEHFRTVLAQAVERRLRSDSPVLAELSGGMDSSAIVCIADNIIARGTAETTRLDTVSCYNDSEPHWNERPYFTRVEERRGRTGWHIEVGAPESVPRGEWAGFAATPFSAGNPSAAGRQFAACLAAQQNRVVLSGMGGDEVTGGVPTPVPELMDLLATARFKALAGRLTVWALSKRKPWIHLFLETVRGFLPLSVVGVPKYLRPAHWLDPGFVKRHRAALRGYSSRVRFIGPLPSFQECLFTFDVLRRQLACSVPPREPLYEKRFPYLDRTLLEFICAVPRAQLVRPGERRSLMRRALTGIVPDEILNRKRKAFAVRSPTADICAEWTRWIEKGEQMVSHAREILDANLFSKEVEQARCGRDVHIVAITRTLGIESWLRNMRSRGILKSGSPRANSYCVRPDQRRLIGERSLKSSAS